LRKKTSSQLEEWARGESVSASNFRLSAALRLRRSILRAALRSAFHVLARVHLTGLENIPRGTAYVAAVNHISIYDPPLLLGFWPEILQAIGAVDVFDKPLQGTLLRLYGTVPVHRGQYDRELIDTILSMLRAGHPVMIAPEGGRSHALAMRRAKPGIGYILDEACVPVVPVGITGTTDDFLKNALHFRRLPLEVRVGKPFTLPPIEGRGAARRLARQYNADLVMRRIAGLLPPQYRGVYADSALSIN
jgi:1-acyl-sn-glycerol-3-phosphate acyltransferase